MAFKAPGPSVGFFSSGAAGDRIVFSTSVRPRQGPPYTDGAKSIADAGYAKDVSSFSIVDETSWKPASSGHHAPTQHSDFHYRLWVMPPIIQLTNPPLDTDIPFRLWNTRPTPEELQEILVNGSSVLSFDIGPGTVFSDFEYRSANLRIGAGEPSIDAIVRFITDNLEAELKVLATISETFNLIPDVPVREEWEFKTEILKNYRGDEQRIALRRYPRLKQEFDVEIIDLRQRREQYLLLRKNIVVQTIIAFYQYGTKVTGDTPTGTGRFYFDPARTNARLGEFMAIVNTSTEQVLLGRVDIIHSDGVTMNVATEQDVIGASQTWVAIPCFSCTVDDGSGITMNSVTGTLSIKAQTFTDPDLVRPNATRTFETFDGLPFLNRRPLTQAAEEFAYRREIIDNETGVRDISSRDKHPEVSGQRRFHVQRNQDPEEMDYWRSFFDHVRGAQKSFLLSTYFPDMTFAPGQLPLGVTASSFTINEGEIKSLMTDYESWKRFELEYSNKERSQHVITSSTSNADGTLTIGFSPAIPDGEVYRNPVKISYLMRVRASDRIVWDHYANYSELSFGIVTTDQ